jgi:hypothetical protein
MNIAIEIAKWEVRPPRALMAGFIKDWQVGTFIDGIWTTYALVPREDLANHIVELHNKSLNKDKI